MGIELPMPQGGTEGQVPRTETYSANRAVEIGQRPDIVEQKATERPSYQEVRNGQGAGNAGAPVVTSDVTDTSKTAATQTLSLDDVPVVAADEDLIEKQWVDSVKRIIRETRSDPYNQGVAISRLQADYLQKRYGKTVGDGA